MTLGFGAAVGVISGLAQGCGNSVSPDEMCAACDSENLATFACYNTANTYKGSVCMPGNASNAQVYAECKAVHGGILDIDNIVLWPCDGLADTAGDTGGADTTCTGWNPGSHVTLVGSVRHVDQAFVDDLIDAPEHLTECDSARLIPETSGVGYKVVSAATSSFVYKLGLRNNDIVLKINNQTLNSSNQAATRLGSMYFGNGTLSYGLQIKRSGVTQTLNYVIDP